MKWGLVLSGGAAHGLANAGVIQCLHENGLRPDYVAGSSMGAIVAAVYAYGHPPDVFREILGQVAVTNLAKISENAFKGGLHSGLLRQRLGEHLQPYLGDATIGDCELPFVCVAGQIQQPIEWKNILQRGFTEQALNAVRSWVFPPETPLLQAVLASSAIPVVFSPVEIAGREYVDMIHFGAIPARTLRERCAPEIVIATDTDPRFDQLEKRLPQALRQFLQAGHHQVATSLAHCDLIIKPTMPASPLRFDRGLEFVEAGHLATQNQLAEIQQLLRQG